MRLNFVFCHFVPAPQSENGGPFTAHSTLSPPKMYGWNYLPTRQRTAKNFASGAFNVTQGMQEVSKEVVGIHVLLNGSLFACDILRRFLPRVSPVKSTSAALRC
jgi:hypothetical protein